VRGGPGGLKPRSGGLPPGMVERAAERTVYGVREILRTVRTLLEGTYSGIWVEGEIGGFKVHQSGHRYFELREAGGVLPAVMWRGVAEATRARPADGVRFRCLGTLTVWEGGGKFQMVVQRVEEAGAGDIAARIEALKKKLQAEGLTAPERKRPLPWIPRSIGIVTSLSGAALRDVIKVLSRRVPVPIVVAHCAVQGDDAPAAIVAALRRIASRSGIDVVILTRGGGGAQDLAAFNEEIVARAVAACPAPVVTAVGHEVDVTVVDFVSDLRAATPSEAAERVAPTREDVAERLRWACDRAAVAARKLLGPAAQTIDGSLDRAHRGVRACIGSQRRDIERLHGRLQAAHPRCRLAE
ncbi:MAG: exodeoxyribonuclease VII large subunit, partial [Myxococcota bacterium]|nr:exodeoxyribonuclease VII large subunit [Myxococcota bacterium]